MKQEFTPVYWYAEAMRVAIQKAKIGGSYREEARVFLGIAKYHRLCAMGIFKC